MQNGGCAAAIGGAFATFARSGGAEAAANAGFGGAEGAISAANGAKGAANAAFGGRGEAADRRIATRTPDAGENKVRRIANADLLHETAIAHRLHP